MSTPNWSDPAVAKLGASLVGSLVSLRFVSGTWPERALMFVGGASLSYYSTEAVARWIEGGADTVGLVGFFLGLLGMTLVSKLYEAIQAIDGKQIADAFRAWISRKWGA